MLPVEIQFKWALDSLGDARKVIHINDAQSKHIYWCPDCKGRLFPKLGDIRSHHFAHATEFDHTSESQVHAAAKEKIIQVIREWKSGKSAAPQVISERYSDASEFFSPNPELFEAKMEYRFGKNRKADVMILRNSEPLFGSKPLFGIEVYQTHFVDYEKSKEYDQAGIPWIEVIGEAILRGPLQWHDIRPVPTRFVSYDDVKAWVSDEDTKEEGHRPNFRMPWWKWALWIAGVAGTAIILNALFPSDD